MANQYLPPVTTVPSALPITDISRSRNMVVTVSVPASYPVANTYIVGMAVKLYVPVTYGMYQANGLVGTILSLLGNVFILNIDSSLFDTFVVPVNPVESPPSISPNGSRNLQYNNNTDLVPFQSLNNIGN